MLSWLLDLIFGSISEGPDPVDAIVDDADPVPH